MRFVVTTLTAWLLVAGLASAADRADASFDWDTWRHLPVQDGGRHKPLDTLAWETLRTLCNRASVADPETGQKLNSTAFYLAMLFDWEGSDEPADPHVLPAASPRTAYFRNRQPDKWDRAPLLRVDYLALRDALGMDADQKYISPAELDQATLQVPHSDRRMPFVAWAEQLVRNKSDGFTAFETKALELADKFWSYQEHRMGKRLCLVPLPGSESQDWVSIAQLVRSNYGDYEDPTGGLRKAKEEYIKARAAYRDGDPEAFNQSATAFIAALGKVGPTLGDYPQAATIDLEVAYNRWVPFRFAWVFMLAAVLSILLSKGTGWRLLYGLGLGAYTAGIVAMLVGFGMRLAISGRAPVTNMYESVVYLGLGTAVLGLVLELFHRKRFILAAAATVTTVALVLADNCPATLDSSLRPLQPVLRNNFWLVTHVMTITLSYAAFALALGVGNITLGYYLVGSRNHDTIAALSNFTYRSLQIGVLLLAVGTILGGVWADYSWGRFWGWDPKEVWALIALIGYLAVLHSRYIGWVDNFGLAALSVICFSLVLMAWYGVNFVLGAGLHSYGFGGGGQGFVYGAVLLQFLYVALSAARRFTRQTPTRVSARPGSGGLPASLSHTSGARPESIARSGP